jgi:hypothetical protein
MRTISARRPLPGHERDPGDDHDHAGRRGGAGEAALQGFDPDGDGGRLDTLKVVDMRSENA